MDVARDEGERFSKGATIVAEGGEYFPEDFRWEGFHGAGRYGRGKTWSLYVLYSISNDTQLS